MKRKIFPIIILSLLLFNLANNAQTCNTNYLNAIGNKLYDSNGNQVRLTGVNWFGFETSMGYFHGIWSRDHKSMLKQIKDQGFNCIRIPWNNGMLSQDISGRINPYGTDPYTGVTPMNVEESTKSKPIEILDITIKWCQENNMKVILDNHSREPDGYMAEALWYTAEVSHQQWIDDWKMIADRYKDYDAVIAMDINNEPHGAYGAGSRWGTGDLANDWSIAAQECGNAILSVNPNVLIMIEGTEEYQETSYWWGGNLQGARDFPVVLTNPNKLVYSPHEYGPTVFNQDWFSDPDFPENMPEIWETNFNYLHTNGTSPLFIGEFGIREAGGNDEIWFDKFLEFMGQKGHSWTFWCWNPNSGDTGGLLDDQWANIVEWKMAKLRPHLAAEIPNCGGTTDIIPVTGVELTPSSLSLVNGETGTLTATIYPSNSTNKSLVWNSDNPSVATVNNSGIVTATSEGTATITVTTVDGSFVDSCIISVIPEQNTIPVTGISVAPTTFTIEVGQSSSLEATITPENATNTNLSWTSDNTSIATVDPNGIVTAINEGTTSITATTNDGNFTASSIVTVKIADIVNCDFGTPLITPLPSINSSFNNIYVIGNGPDLSNVSNFTINWDLASNGLWQLSMNTNNGQPDWWNDLKNNATHSFNSEQPELILSGTGFAGLDGTYYVTIDDGNFVMDETSGAFSIYFSNSDIAPCTELKKALSNTDIDKNINGILVYPNPFISEITINLKEIDKVLKIELLNQLGQLMSSVDASQVNSDLLQMNIGDAGNWFMLKIYTDSNVINKKIIRQ